MDSSRSVFRVVGPLPDAHFAEGTTYRVEYERVPGGTARFPSIEVCAMHRDGVPAAAAD